MTFASYFARAVDDEIPLVEDAYKPAEPDEAPDYTPPRLRPIAVLAIIWYIVHISIVGAVYYTLLVDAEGYCTSPLQPIAAIVLPLVLWGITLTVRRCARREKNNGGS